VISASDRDNNCSVG